MNSTRGLVAALQYPAEQLVALAAAYGFSPRITSTLRTSAEQSKLYQEYLQKLSRGIPTLPAAPPGTSAHERGLAFDMVTNSAASLAWCGAVWNSWGGSWHPSDVVHFGVR